MAGAPAEAGADLAALREAARESLETTCGRCHDGSRPTARPAAIRIFDLHEADFLLGVTDVQMDHMVGRFESFKMPPQDRETVRRYLDAERARRAGGSAPSGGSGH
jgi:hypothetical protein